MRHKYYVRVQLLYLDLGGFRVMKWFSFIPKDINGYDFIFLHSDGKCIFTCAGILEKLRKCVCHTPKEISLKVHRQKGRQYTEHAFW